MGNSPSLNFIALLKASPGFLSNETGVLHYFRRFYDTAVSIDLYVESDGSFRCFQAWRQLRSAYILHTRWINRGWHEEYAPPVHF
jgi:hypothetical protein